MKHIKNIELFEKVFTKSIRPIGDFLFYKFFEPEVIKKRIYAQAKIDEIITPDEKCRVGINFSFRALRFEKDFGNIRYTGNFNMSEENLFFILNFMNSMKEFCDVKKDFNLKINGTNVLIRIDFPLENVEKIKNLPEYDEWLKSAERDYSDFLLRKTAKKYNL